MKAGSSVHFALAAVLALMIVGTARADINGSVWLVPEGTATNATIANVPVTTADVTFTVPSINFDSRVVGGYMLGGFLATSGAFNIVYSGGATAGTPLDSATAGTLFDFTGTVTVANGDTFTVTHDDGLTLVIGGATVINQPGGTAPVTQTRTYTGASGNLPFELVYGECCGAPAVLDISLPLVSITPEPSSAGLLGAMLLGFAPLAVVLRRKWFS